MTYRRNPRIHIRFESSHILDKLEIWAHQRGEKLIPWARKSLIKQARQESVADILSAHAEFSTFEAVSILRQMAGPSIVQKAREEVELHMQEVKQRTRDDFS